MYLNFNTVQYPVNKAMVLSYLFCWLANIKSIRVLSELNSNEKNITKHLKY